MLFSIPDALFFEGALFLGKSSSPFPFTLGDDRPLGVGDSLRLLDEDDSLPLRVSCDLEGDACREVSREFFLFMQERAPPRSDRVHRYTHGDIASPRRR
mmetsp:Transcript_47250/g.131952  ORF Transcript_47250/g.131952 Transcript_47250/m.131952 type:complete len:99 (-) Transcript_47250:76-372(-)